MQFVLFQTVLEDVFFLKKGVHFKKLKIFAVLPIYLLICTTAGKVTSEVFCDLLHHEQNEIQKTLKHLANVHNQIDFEGSQTCIIFKWHFKVLNPLNYYLPLLIRNCTVHK